MYEDLISGHHLLKLIAFSSNLVQLLGEGLATYDTERYKQFAKMLSRLIRHAVVYLADVHEIFKYAMWYNLEMCFCFIFGNFFAKGKTLPQKMFICVLEFK